jgi:integrase
MSKSLPNARRREPVYRGKKRVENLWRRQLGDGTIVFDFAGRLHKGAKPTFRRLQATSVADAIAEIAELQVDASRGQVARADRRLLVRDLIDAYLVHAQGRLGERTYGLYEQRLRDFAVPALGSLRAADVDVRSIRDFSSKLIDGRIKSTIGKKLSGNSARGVLTALSSAFEYGGDFHGLPGNPVQQLGRKHRPSSKRLREPNYLSANELETLLAGVADDTHRTVLTVLAFSALRISEALALRHYDVDLEAGVAVIRKGKTRSSETTAKLLPAAVRALKEHRRRLAAAGLHLLKPEAFALANPETGTVPHRRNTLRTIARVSGGTTTQHDLRHTLIALALDQNATLPDAARLARHSSPAVTASTYAGLLRSKETAAADRLLAAGIGA